MPSFSLLSICSSQFYLKINVLLESLYFVFQSSRIKFAFLRFSEKQFKKMSYDPITNIKQEPAVELVLILPSVSIAQEENFTFNEFQNI
jgi:hypothetical protein